MTANICALFLCHINQFHCCLSPFMSILNFFLSICLLPNVFRYPHLRFQPVNNKEHIHCFPFSVKAPKAPCSHSCKSLCDGIQFSSLNVFENRNSTNKHSPDFFSESKGPALHEKFQQLLNSTLKAVKSHETAAQCLKKTVYPIKFKTGVNPGFDFGFSVFPAALRHWQTSSWCCCNNHHRFPSAKAARQGLQPGTTRQCLHSPSCHAAMQGRAVAWHRTIPPGSWKGTIQLRGDVALPGNTGPLRPRHARHPRGLGPGWYESHRHYKEKKNT